MRKTEHYELNLVEGTDLVNPLVQDVPNYEAIDEALFENANSGISVATELLSGTVHAITRSNPNSAVFRFVATSDYKSGNTFTVDGVQVTALLPSGEALTTKSFCVNANVLCCLVGTMLTVFTVKSGDVTASDSDKLGGQLPSYYGTASAVANANSLAQGANAISLSNKSLLESALFVVSFDANTGTLVTRSYDYEG